MIRTIHRSILSGGEEKYKIKEKRGDDQQICKEDLEPEKIIEESMI